MCVDLLQIWPSVLVSGAIAIGTGAWTPQDRHCSAGLDYGWRLSERDGSARVEVERLSSRTKSACDVTSLPGGAAFLRSEGLAPSARCAVVRAGQDTLVGIDNGEYGGGLWRVGESGRGLDRVLAENVRDIKELGEKILALTVGRVPSEDARIVALKRRPGGAYEAISTFSLGPGSAAWGRRAGGLAVAGAKGIAVVSSAGEPEWLLHMDLAGLSPLWVWNASEDSTLVGFAHYLLALDLAPAPTTRWFGPSTCVEARWDATAGCVCTPATEAGQRP